MSWRYFIWNLIASVIALNGIMMGNRHSRVWEECNSCVVTVCSVCSRKSTVVLFMLKGSSVKVHLLLNLGLILRPFGLWVTVRLNTKDFGILEAVQQIDRTRWQLQHSCNVCARFKHDASAWARLDFLVRYKDSALEQSGLSLSGSFHTHL